MIDPTSPDVAASLERLAELGSMSVSALQARLPDDLTDARLSLLNFERWLHATSSPSLQLGHLLSVPPVLGQVLEIMGVAQPVADSLIQNPELIDLLGGSGEEVRSFDADREFEDATRLISSASSYSHALDRLRFIKQRWTVQIVWQDVFGGWAQPIVWKALSDLADTLLRLAVPMVWNNYAQDRRLAEVGGTDLAAMPEFGVVAFGKLAGSELNYSSDIDLVYVTDAVLEEVAHRHVSRYAESLGRALSDRTGRGSLYRVDLRLRPYGQAGPLVPSMEGIEAYYERYAEPWEVQALLKSRVVYGSEALVARWEAMRDRLCFRPQLGETALEAMVAMRDRIERHSHAEDIKRGHGGIRDVEFLVQILQLLRGYAVPALRSRNTLESLFGLEAAGFIQRAEAQTLGSGYEFLRKLEHRCQLLGDQQTHELPADPEARRKIARLMGFETAAGLEMALTDWRRKLSELYGKYLSQPDTDGGSVEQFDVEQLREQVAPIIGDLGLAWLASFDAEAELLRAVAENAGSQHRVRRISDLAPGFIGTLMGDLPLTELVLSGEIEEAYDGPARIAALSSVAPLQGVAELYRACYGRIYLQFVLNPNPEVGEALSEIADALIRHLAERLRIDSDILALGSYARRELSVSSDLDLLWLVDSPERHAEAEASAEALLAVVDRLRRYGAPISVDLRLRPDGGKGMLVRTYEGLKAYDLDGMELWERFALGQARLVHGAVEAVNVTQAAAYALPITPERIKELRAMKRRVETERVKPQHKGRDVKLGGGGLSDIEWLVHLYEMQMAPLVTSGTLPTMPERIATLGRLGYLTMLEVHELQEGREHLLLVRNWVKLQGLEGDIVPENPTKLDRLASAMGFGEGNEFLLFHESVVRRVREIFVEALTGWES